MRSRRGISARSALDGKRARSGAALLEAIVAIAILATAGVAALSMATESMRVIERARVEEDAFRQANAFFEAVALWTIDDLDRRLGDRRQGDWILRIERPFSDLYVATLSDSIGGRELLRTSLFRPGVRDATR